MGRKSDAGPRILAASTSLFWHRGFEAVGTDEICRAAGVNKGTLYHFYGNKQELALAVIRGHEELFRHVTGNQLQGKKPRDKILTYLKLVRDVQMNQAQETGRVPGCPCGNLSVEMAGKDDEITDAVAAWFREIIAFFSGNLRELNPDISPRTAMSRANQIFTYWQGALLMARTMNDSSVLTQALVNIKKTIQEIEAGE